MGAQYHRDQIQIDKEEEEILTKKPSLIDSISPVKYKENRRLLDRQESIKQER